MPDTGAKLARHSGAEESLSALLAARAAQVLPCGTGCCRGQATTMKQQQPSSGPPRSFLPAPHPTTFLKHGTAGQTTWQQVPPSQRRPLKLCTGPISRSLCLLQLHGVMNLTELCIRQRVQALPREYQIQSPPAAA